MLLLILLVSLGIKIDSNILSFLKFNNDDLLNVNLSNLITLEHLFHSAEYFYFTNLKFLNEIRSRIENISKREMSSNFQERRTFVIEMIYGKEKFYDQIDSSCKDYLINTRLFNERHKKILVSLENIK